MVLQSVHSDRSGRVFVAADYGAAALDGPSPAALERASALPPDAQLVPLADRAAIGLDRRGQPRSLGPTRWAVAAVLGAGHLRTHLPAIEAASGASPLEALPYAAVAADARGDLVVAAMPLGASLEMSKDVSTAITARLGTEPSNRLLRQLARCAREYQCPYAQNAFRGQGECALPLGAPSADGAAPVVALRRRAERAPLEPVALKIGVDDAVAVAIAHLAAGGASVSFGHACEGEPLGGVRSVVEVTARIRAATATGAIVLRTSGSSAAALARVAEAGLDRVVIALASAHGPMYERVHRPLAHRWTDVRASLREAAARNLAITVELLALPGLSDRATELRALVALLGELPSGTVLEPVDLSADPYTLLAALPAESGIVGMAELIDRLRVDAAHVRLAA